MTIVTLAAMLQGMICSVATDESLRKTRSRTTTAQRFRLSGTTSITTPMPFSVTHFWKTVMTAYTHTVISMIPKRVSRLRNLCSTVTFPQCPFGQISSSIKETKLFTEQYVNYHSFLQGQITAHI